MTRRSRIVLCGKSMILDMTGISLSRCSQYEVITLLPPWPSREELHALGPDVILFDVETSRPEAAFSLLETSPGLLLIALNPDGNIVKMWSGKQLHQPSTRDLLEMISEQLKNSPIESGARSPVFRSPKLTQERDN